MRPNLHRIGRIGLIYGVLLAAGCSEPTPVAQPGCIYLGRPEVFTRERLLNRRLAEQAWLEDQLKLPVDPTFQGYRDVREFSGLYTKLSASLDPLRGAQDTAQA